MFEMELFFEEVLDSKAYSIIDFFQSPPSDINGWMSEYINLGNDKGFYETLQSIIRQETGFRKMVDSAHWAASDLCNSTEGSEIKNIILDQDDTFWMRGKYLCSLLEPIFKLHEKSEYDARFAGLIFKLYDYFVQKKPIYDFLLCWTKDGKDEALYYTVAYLNPYLSGYAYETDKRNCLDVIIEILISDEEDKQIIRQQIEAYDRKDPLYFENGAFKVSDVYKHPKKWWEDFGRKVLKLQGLAIKILSQSFSTLPFIKKWDAFECVDFQKISNRLNLKAMDSEWLYDLFRIMLNEKFMNISRKVNGSDTLMDLMKSYQS